MVRSGGSVGRAAFGNLAAFCQRERRSVAFPRAREALWVPEVRVKNVSCVVLGRRTLRYAFYSLTAINQSMDRCQEKSRRRGLLGEHACLLKHMMEGFSGRGLFSKGVTLVV